MYHGNGNDKKQRIFRPFYGISSNVAENTDSNIRIIALLIDRSDRRMKFFLLTLGCSSTLST